MVEFVQLTTECCWGQPSDPCQRGCLTSHACVMWGPRTLNADDDDDDDDDSRYKKVNISKSCINFITDIKSQRIKVMKYEL